MKLGVTVGVKVVLGVTLKDGVFDGVVIGVEDGVIDGEIDGVGVGVNPIVADGVGVGTMTWQLAWWKVVQPLASITLINTTGAVSNNGGKLKYWDGGTAPEKDDIKVSLFP